MAANTNLSITELDFGLIKSNLKAYLQQQSKFTDYNFNGSNISVLLDVLAYNTHYNAFYVNMIGNEMFLDTAILRESVVSRAKELGYVPASARGPDASLLVTINDARPTSPASITIPRGTKFTTSANGQTYVFQTDTDFAISAFSNGTANLYSTTVKVFEGVESTEQITVTATSKYIISNPTVDLSSLLVTVQGSSSDLSTFPYSLATDINTVNENSRVYFLQEVEGGKFEVYFGDGVIGKELLVGNIVKLRYRTTNGALLNGANTFSGPSTISGFTSITIKTTIAAASGADQESIDSIKFNAPKQFEVQNRAVTSRDYERIIVKNYPEIVSISVWGGEENVPPVYGSVFVSARPSTGENLSNSKKESIKATLSSINLLTTTVEFVDPTYIYANITSTVRYNPNATPKTDGQMITTISNSITNYFNTQLGQFGKGLRLSRLSRFIDNAETSVLSNDTTLQLELRSKSISLSKKNTYTFTFNQEVVPGSLTSSQFTLDSENVFLDDNSSGIVRAYFLDTDGNKNLITSNSGTIDYDTGTVTLTSFLPSSILNSILSVRVSTVKKDIIPTLTEIIIIGSKTILVVKEVDELALTSGSF
jgi:hypothetical protein